MLLTINAGNTTVTFGAFDGSHLIRKWKFSAHPQLTSDEWLLKVRTLFDLEKEKLSWNDLKSVVICSVVPSINHILKMAFEGKKVHLISYQENFSFKIKVPEPGKVGDDRLVAAEAALRDYGAPLIIVDAGTATTINAISRNREFLGGAITSGIGLSTTALSHGTAMLPTLSPPLPPEKAIGITTTEALRSGIVLGHACMIDGMISRFKAELAEHSIKTVITGGAATLLKPLCAEVTHLDPDLILRGMFYLHESISE